ncbi:MAG TPA: hypothetical protein VMQ39_00995, partial [Candidatus Dormibacteraeota bacterium]|nr:hypothetical protein [Candidatus Dormibacteraeota bacterium]
MNTLYLSSFPEGELRQLPLSMANTQRSAANGVTLSANPIFAVQEIGQLGRNFLREIGSIFWFIAHTFEETI